MKDKILATVFAALLFTGPVGVAQADVVDIVVSQVGNNVIFNGSGSIDLTGFGAPNSYPLSFSRSQANHFGGTSRVVDVYYTIFSFTPLPLSNDDFVFDQIAGYTKGPFDS